MIAITQQVNFKIHLGQQTFQSYYFRDAQCDWRRKHLTGAGSRAAVPLIWRYTNTNRLPRFMQLLPYSNVAEHPIHDQKVPVGHLSLPSNLRLIQFLVTSPLSLAQEWPDVMTQRHCFQSSFFPKWKKVDFWVHGNVFFTLISEQPHPFSRSWYQRYVNGQHLNTVSL